MKEIDSRDPLLHWNMFETMVKYYNPNGDLPQYILNNSDKGSGNTLHQVVKLQGNINCPQYLSCIEPRYKTKGNMVYLLLTTSYKET